MARNKNYDAHITNLKNEIEKTTKKLQTLNEQLTTILKEKEENEATTLYQYIRANNISMKDIVKTFHSDKDGNELKKTQNKNTTTQSRTKKSNTKKLSNNNQKGSDKKDKTQK